MEMPYGYCNDAQSLSAGPADLAQYPARGSIKAQAREGMFSPMEMHQIRYFLAVCDSLNFTRAAEACNVTQPALTRAIQKLEEELGSLLLHRERSRTHLTDFGQLMRPH